MERVWLEITLEIPIAAIDLVSQALVDLGSCGVTVVEQKLDTFDVPEEPSYDGEQQAIKAYFAEPQDRATLDREVRNALAGLTPMFPDLPEIELRWQSLRDEDWASNWQQHFQPFRVGHALIIRPSWVELSAEPGTTVLTMDPGRAFGTGSHATTALCLEVFADLTAKDSAPSRVLDVGTGSGILAMAAAALGAERVLACDIDSDACQVARDNIALNQQQALITVTGQPLEELTGTYDLVFANILAGENIRLAPYLVERLAPGGYLLLSGILIEQEQAVIDGFSHEPIALTETRHREEWTCLVYRRHG